MAKKHKEFTTRQIEKIHEYLQIDRQYIYYTTLEWKFLSDDFIHHTYRPEDKDELYALIKSIKQYPAVFREHDISKLEYMLYRLVEIFPNIEDILENEDYDSNDDD